MLWNNKSIFLGKLVLFQKLMSPKIRKTATSLRWETEKRWSFWFTTKTWGKVFIWSFKVLMTSSSNEISISFILKGFDSTKTGKLESYFQHLGKSLPCTKGKISVSVKRLMSQESNWGCQFGGEPGEIFWNSGIWFPETSPLGSFHSVHTLCGVLQDVSNESF